MVNHNDGSPLTLHLSKHLENGLLRSRINTSKWLIHEVQICFLGKRSSQKDPLLLSARELPDLAVSEISKSDPIQTLERGVSIFLTDWAKPPKFAISPHAHDIERGDRKFPIHTLSLWDVPNGRTDRLERLPSKSHQTRSTRHQPETRFDERALSGPIGANNRNQLRVFRRVVIDVPKHWLSVIGDSHGMNRERAVGGMLRPLDRGHGDDSVGGEFSVERHPPSGASPPSARAMVVTLWSIMPK